MPPPPPQARSFPFCSNRPLALTHLQLGCSTVLANLSTETGLAGNFYGFFWWQGVVCQNEIHRVEGESSFFPHGKFVSTPLSICIFTASSSHISIVIQGGGGDLRSGSPADLMENGKFVRELKFGIGDGHLQYYLFNYRFPDVEPKDMALVLL